MVRFHGFVPQAECVAHFAGADALILNSVWECGGAVVLEAMAMRLPVIGPDWGGPGEYIDDGTGLRVAPTPRGTYAVRLADAIRSLARDPARRKEMGAAGLRKITNYYDWETKIDQIQEIYIQAVGMKQPPGPSLDRKDART